MNINSVDLFFANISNVKTEEVKSRYIDRIEKKRREAFERCSNVNRKKEIICAGAFLSLVLEKYGHASSEIQYGLHEKPYIEGSDFFFNMSHSGNLLMLAVSAKPVGADVQKKVSYREPLAKRIFSFAEFESFPREDLGLVWAIKESFSKLTGEGIGIDFSDIQYTSEGDCYKIACKDVSGICRCVYKTDNYTACVSATEDFSAADISWIEL